MKFYAHINKQKKELLIDHLHQVGQLSSQFASEFGYEKIGLQLGLLHDVGKHTERFQKVLSGDFHKIDHAVVAAECYSELAGSNICGNNFVYLMICHCLNAHHSILRGDFDSFDNEYPLPDDYNLTFTDDRGKQNALSNEAEYQEILKYINKHHLLIQLLKNDVPDTEDMTNAEKMLFVRMMQSCLVDADYSATATFEDPEYTDALKDRILNVDIMLQQLAEYHENLVAHSDKENQMNQLRQLVYKDAAEAGTGDSGIYTLTAPTGTAKTLAMMRFALEHAKKNDKKRIIIVLPYLSITTQNAKIYQAIFGNDTVLEDDSITEYPDEARIYADRWNYPVVVTTSVKFFETLQAAKASDLRKLHEVANSIVIFDESQTLAADMTDITLKTLQALSKYFRATIILSTATQPSYQYRQALQGWTTKEIIKDPVGVYKAYAEAKKTKIDFSINHEWTAEEIAQYFGDYKQALCISNTTNKALELYDYFTKRYGESKTLYLSSRLCPAHKAEVIEQVKRKLQQGEPCYLLSTQCVEAGVDLDFPAGGREYASLTAISQTAGRINRNGKKSHADMLVFRREKHSRYDFPSDAYMNEANITYHMALKFPDLDTNNLTDIDEYYRQLYSGDSTSGRDKENIRYAESECNIQEMANAYKLIEEKNQCNVIVPYIKKIDEFNTLKNKLSEQKEKDYVLPKKELYVHHEITVSVVVNKESLTYIKNHCSPIKLYTHVGPMDVNWYIADKDNIYDQKTGLKTKENIEEGGILDV